MVSTELGACEWLVWDLRRSNLVEAAKLEPMIEDYLQKNPHAEPIALAEYLVAQGLITEFQSERLLQGKNQGFVVGSYILQDVLGSGSMGTVYKAKSRADQFSYAVKILPRRSMWNVRIARRKIRAFEQIKHPSVVPFVDVGTTGNQHYLVWKYVLGEVLDRYILRVGKIVPEHAADIALQTAEGLQACQQEGIMHGLLKPGCIMLGPRGQVSILDFGIGSLIAETEGESLVDTMSTANVIASGMDCASPESILDPAHMTSQGDQYSLGCILYFLLVGQVPFPDGGTAEKMIAHQMRQPTPIKDFCPHAPAELIAVVEKLMQKKPENRYASMEEVVQELRPYAKRILTAGAQSTAIASDSVVLKAGSKVEPPEKLTKLVGPSTQTPLPSTISLAGLELPTRETMRVIKEAGSSTALKKTSNSSTVLKKEPSSIGSIKLPKQLAPANGETPKRRISPLLWTLGALTFTGLIFLASLLFHII